MTILRDALKRFASHEGTVRSGYIAFCMVLGIFPFLIFVAHLSGFLLGEKESQNIINTLISFTPEYLKQTLQPVIESLLSQGRVDVMSIALLAAIWFPSKAIDGLRVGFDHAYGFSKKRTWLKGRLISMVAVMFGVLVSMILSALVILGPIISRLVETISHLDIPLLLSMLRNTAGFVTFLLFAWFLHRFLPSRRFDPKNHIWTGILTASILWIVVAIAFGIYLDHSRHYQVFYGTLAGVAITMMFFYFTCAIFLISAELNAALDSDRN